MNASGRGWNNSNVLARRPILTKTSGPSRFPVSLCRKLSSVKDADRAVVQQRHDALFTLLLGGLSIAALFFYYVHRQLLLYGDAVAHINIARRVVDNRHEIGRASCWDRVLLS